MKKGDRPGRRRSTHHDFRDSGDREIGQVPGPQADERLRAARSAGQLRRQRAMQGCPRLLGVVTAQSWRRDARTGRHTAARAWRRSRSRRRAVWARPTSSCKTTAERGGVRQGKRPFRRLKTTLATAQQETSHAPRPRDTPGVRSAEGIKMYKGTAGVAPQQEGIS